jgi:hypothetical protein
MEDYKISFRFKNLSALKEPNMNNPRRQGGYSYLATRMFVL